MVNDQVSVEDLLGIIIASGNDACRVNEGMAGSEENFADIMNEKASRLA